MIFLITHSLVLLNETSLSFFFLLLLLFCFFSALKNFNRGIVEPPNIKVVNNTIMSVVVIITWRVSSLKSKWSDSAYDIAPRRPLNHIINIIFLVIWCSRKRLTSKANGKMLAALPIRHKIKDQTTNAGSNCQKEKKGKRFKQKN